MIAKSNQNDQRTHEKIMHLLEGITRLSSNARTYEDDDKIEGLENKLFDLCKDYEDGRIYLKGYPHLIERLDTCPEKNENKQLKTKNPVFPFQNAKWEDYIIFGIDLTKVRIKNLKNKQEEIFTYRDLGMIDGRTQKHNKIWEFLYKLIGHDGYYSFDDIKDREQAKHAASRFNKHLKNLFNIKDSAYTAHAKKARGYRLRIQTRKPERSNFVS